MTDRPELDDLAKYNGERWDALAGAGVDYARPWLELDAPAALRLVDPDGILNRHLAELDGADVLCLAAGGGQQSVAFSLLGAHVTVVDLSEEQLERDREAAAHYGFRTNIVQGDMRDLSAFADEAFDLVYQAYSINFVPGVVPVHAEVSRVLRPGGLYRLEWFNPFTQTVDDEKWNGAGYLLAHPYRDGRDLTELFPYWDVERPDGESVKLESPKEYVHALSTMVNSLVSNGFVILHLREDTGDEPDPAPGSWPHYMQVVAPYLTIWSRLLPAATGNVE